MSFAPSVRAPALLPPPLPLPQPLLLLIKDKYEILIMRGVLKASSSEREGGGSESYGGHIKYDGTGNGKFVC